MKRTWEYVLSIIGVSIAAIFLIVTIIAAVYLNSVDLKEMVDYSLMTDSQEFSSSEIDMSVKFFMGLLWAGII
jgi:amino acid permease